jgi:hypothetical protein
VRRIKVNFLAIAAFLALSAGLYYSGAKFHVPWFGGNDFQQYYMMVTNPFDNDALSPWAYRIFPTTIAHYVHQSGFFYESNLTPFKEHYVSYNGVDYDPSVLSALIFTNYLFFTIAAFFLYKSIKLIFEEVELEDVTTSFFLPSLIFLSLSTGVHGYAGLTEGAALFFVSILLYLYLKNYLILFFVANIISVTSRELVPLILIFYLLVSPGTQRAKYLITSGIAFTTYFAMRLLLQIPGNEHQTNPSSLIENLLNFELTKDFFMQAMLANNITFFAVLLLVLHGLKGIRCFAPYMLAISILTVLGIATGIGNNVGRILNLALPLLVIGLANWKVLLSKKTHK